MTAETMVNTRVSTTDDRNSGLVNRAGEVREADEVGLGPEPVRAMLVKEAYRQ